MTTEGKIDAWLQYADCDIRDVVRLLLEAYDRELECHAGNRFIHDAHGERRNIHDVIVGEGGARYVVP